MRRSIRAIPGALAVIAMITFAPTSAAATGTLVVGGYVYTDPAGCLYLGYEQTTTFENNTDRVATIYRTAGCRGDATGILTPGNSGTFTGQSVQVG
ncbi:hypothetical protein [Nocardia sp. NPDC051463]|uniref:hypothetical protein n=1 Tax=Nocardia sp. NPDC051463 TaxID=3154845 RepID=UPI00344C9FD2